MARTNCPSRVSAGVVRAAITLGVVVTLGALDAAVPVRAQGAWCAEYSGMDGGTNCGFYTIQQCQAAISGVGGFCSPNPWVSQNPAPRRKARRSNQ